MDLTRYAGVTEWEEIIIAPGYIKTKTNLCEWIYTTKGAWFKSADEDKYTQIFDFTEDEDDV